MHGATSVSDIELSEGTMMTQYTNDMLLSKKINLYNGYVDIQRDINFKLGMSLEMTVMDMGVPD